MVEAEHTRGLSRGVCGLAIRIARAVNRTLGRKGRVWGTRYHVRALTTPREVRHGLVYVLMNHRKHEPAARAALDPCSSAAGFDGFRGVAPSQNVSVTVRKPQTWLAAVGWKRHGLIGLDEAPKAAMRLDIGRREGVRVRRGLPYPGMS
jgi:hypothetical protein